MADVRPFRATRYATDLVGPLETVASPPYDVIDEAARQALASRSPFQFVHLDLPVAAPGEPADARYARAASTWDAWRRAGIVKRDAEPAFYVYWQTFTLPNGSSVTRKGFLGLTRLHAYADKVILPHERTLKGPKADRLALMRATEAQLSQIFLLYDDPSGTVDATLTGALPVHPIGDFKTGDGIRHQIWSVDDPAAVATVSSALADRQLLIADGHHRYETALAYAEEVGGDADHPSQFALAFFANASDPGLVVLPTHRGLHDVPGFDADAFVDGLADIFKLDVLDPRLRAQSWCDTLEEAGAAGPAFVFLVPDAGEVRPVLARLDPERAAAQLAALDVAPSLKTLDVTLLHNLLLEHRLGISREAQAAKTNLAYFKEATELAEQVAGSALQLGVLMNGTPVRRVREVCESGEFMPQKSTFFYPKVLSGVVIYDLNPA